jgi:hypothetical protein
MNINRYLNQIAVYWSRLGTDGFGHPTWNAPVEIPCRWEQSPKEFIAPNGTKVVSSCVVLVNQDLDIGGVLMLGALYSDLNESSPKENEGAFEILQFDMIPNRKATQFVRRAYL